MKTLGKISLTPPRGCFIPRVHHPVSVKCFATRPALRASPPSSDSATPTNNLLDFPAPEPPKSGSRSIGTSPQVARISELLQDVSQPRRQPPRSAQATKTPSERASDGFADLMRTAMEMDKGKHAALRQGNILRGMSSMNQDVLNIANRQRVERLAPPLRLDAFVGRSEAVGPLGLARAIQRLEIKLSQNRVKQDFNYQKFHERAGMKRKRLRSERWRKRFKLGFKAAIVKVQKMRRQGW